MSFHSNKHDTRGAPRSHTALSFRLDSCFEWKIDPMLSLSSLSSCLFNDDEENYVQTNFNAQGNEKKKGFLRSEGKLSIVDFPHKKAVHKY